MKTIGIPEELHKKIVALKLQEEIKTSAELIEKLIIAYRKQKFEEASKLFRKKLKERGMALTDLLKASGKIREEISNEWFPD